MSASISIRRVVATLLATGAIGLVAVSATLTATASPPVATAAPQAVTAPAAPAATGDLEGPQFLSGVVVDVTDDVDGDVYASGQSVSITGDVTGDVIAAAQSITISGNVDGDVRLAGSDVTISGDVARSATVFAATVTVTGSLGADLVGAAGEFTVDGEIGRDMVVSVGRLTVDGSIGGALTYYSDTDARIATGAVDGTVERIAPARTQNVEVSPVAVFVSWVLGLLYSLVALGLVILAVALLLPRWLQRVTDQLVPSPWKALLVGFVASVAVPFALLLLLISIIGAPLALGGLLVWIGLLLATFLHGA